ncbi:PPC domain-containing protein [Brevundimonas goettingensis]|uniref:PPC domain-containing protein n=1 Tax=Brevundimonas goettingensis TaxID=2774190 RepID=A0A975GZT7_9CAUL|nr:PPC domain-containing protein [Brevundimonas goettingensis]QTC92980.1 PPC domain-containing protein [Brevundimonas goettingensis]
MRRSVITATVSALALAAGASLLGGQAMAQTSLQIGGSVTGALDDHDSTLGTGDGQYRFEDYRFTARAGQRLEAIMRSDAFDTYLEVFKAGDEGAESGPLGFDDDGLADGTNARLRFVAPGNGAYTLRARTLSGVEGGDYSLSLSERPAPPRAPRPGGIRLGQTVSGSIADTDAEDDDGLRYDAYAFRAREGQRFAIALKSEDTDSLDPVVHVGQMVGGSFVEIAQNDDAASGGLDSYLVFTAPSSGTFIIRAMPLGTDSTGDYTLSLEEGPPPLDATPIAIGDTKEGELTESDGLNDAGARADAYRFTATAGQRIQAELNSEVLDTVLELFNAKGESIDQDDDSGGDTDSRLTTTLKDGGTYTLQVRAIGDTLLGAYTLKLGEAAPAPAAIPLPFGETVQGEITADGARDDDERGYADYSFQGTEGNRVQIVMRSGDFDTYLQIGKPGDSFEALSSDDDGLGEGTDSRLNYILPETGEYVIRASPLGSDAKGLFSIELTDKGPQPEPGSILVGHTARGTLTDSDGIADDGAFFDAYTITVAEGDKLDVTLVSNHFDAYLDIGKMNDGTWESVASDDDSLSDTHAKVEWTVDEAGTYIIRARSFAPGESGDYTLAVESRK